MREWAGVSRRSIRILLAYRLSNRYPVRLSHHQDTITMGKCPDQGIRTDPLDIRRWAESVGPYAEWLNQNDFSAARQWFLRLRSNDPALVEGAVAEAVAWSFLVRKVDCITPGNLSTGGPDFRCESAGGAFYVEVTNLSRSVVTERTHLSEELANGWRHYGDLTGLIKREVSGKAPQGRHLGVPYLVFATTLHMQASIVCVSRAHVAHVLHSTTAISGDFDPDRGEVRGPLREITRMELSTFTRAFTVDPARRNVSGVLVGGFGTYPDVRVLGVRHPDPVHTFDPDLLEGVPFFEFALWPPDPRVMTRWTLPESHAKSRIPMQAWLELFRS